MEKVYDVVKAHQSNHKGSLALSIPKEAIDELGIKLGDRFVVSITVKGLTYTKRIS
jgi:hypothetical protein